MQYAIGGIALAALILGIVEACKELFNIHGKGSQALAFSLGVFFVGLAEAVSRGLIPPEAVQYIEVVVLALAGGLAAMGYYDLGKRFSAMRNGCCQ